jgi:hypothetical protein
MKLILKTALAVACIALLGVAFAADKMPETECLKSGGHTFGKWYRQAQMFYLPEQAAHTCTRCGSFQNASGRWMQLVKGGPDGIPGGMGKLSPKEAGAALAAEIAKDFPTDASYKSAPVEDRYAR